MSHSNSHESDILDRISALVAEERGLREQSEHRLTAQERQRMRQLEVDLDQCWDLLRQRRAREEYGENPEEARARPVSEVEQYRQ